VTITADSLEATTSGSQQFKSDDISIGHGASLGAARKTDAVNDGTDLISGGSTKVKIG